MTSPRPLGVRTFDQRGFDHSGALTTAGFDHRCFDHRGSLNTRALSIYGKDYILKCGMM